MLLQFAVATSLLVLCQTQVPPFKEECITGAYPPAAGRKIPSYVINLDLPPEQRWNQVVKDKLPGMLDLLQDIKNITEAFFGPKLFALINKYIPLVTKTLPYPFADELNGIAAATKMPLGEITLYNIFYEIFTVCTSTIAEDKQGKLFHARNLDFGLLMGWDIKNHTWRATEILKKIVVEVEFQRGGKTIFKSVQFAGYIGIMTAVKPNMFTFTMNERFKLKGGYIGIIEWILGYRSGSWVGFLGRQVMENETSYITAQKTLAKSELLAPCYFILGGNTTGQASVITRGLKDFDIWTIGSKNSSWYLLQTNYDHWEQPPFYDDRRNPGIRCMNKITRDNAGVASLFNMLSSRPMLNKLTTYTALMQVNLGALETYRQDCPDPCWPW